MRDRLLQGVKEWVPRWWRGEAGPAGRSLELLLWPAEILFRVGVGMRNRGYDAGLLRAEAAPIPVISVGNIGVGGAGKTPFSAWLAGRLLEWGHRPALVLRGYGADEILVHREINPSIPVFAAPRRVAAAREAAARGHDVAVLDDAFQHRALQRDLDLVLLPADGWDSRRRLLPRGPWREAPEAMLRADLVVITHKAASRADVAAVEHYAAERVGADRVVRCRIEATGLLGVAGPGADVAGGPLRLLSGRDVLAVASLADPRAFVEHLVREGARVELAAYADHHDFTVREIEELARRSRGRPLVMTRKEAVKLRGMLPEGIEAWMVDQRVVIERGGEVLDDALRRAVSR